MSQVIKTISKLPDADEDYIEAGYNKYLIKTEDNVPLAITANTISSQETGSFLKTANRSLQIQEIGSTAIDSISIDGITGFGTASVSISHGLGCIPTVLCFFNEEGTGTYKPLPYFEFFYSGGSYIGFISINVRVDIDNLTFDIFTESSPTYSLPFAIKYYIFREEVKEENE